MKLSFEPHTLFFIHPFKIAHGTRISTPVVIIRIESEGITGYGEASMPPYLGEDHASASIFLKKAASLLETISSPFDIGSIMNFIDEIDEGNTAAKAGIDIALHDLQGKILKKPCWKLFGATKEKTPFSTFTIGIDEPEVIKRKIAEAEEFRILKVKLDGINDKIMINTIKNITDKPIAVDVNQGWKTKEQALAMAEWLSDKNVLFIEQALHKDDHDAAHWLFERSPLPLYADESVQRLKDIDIIKDFYHGINIKLMKCTGLHEAKQMIEKARELDLNVLIGCMSETSCAVSAAAQLTPFADHADLDGPMLIRNDLFKGVKFEKGKIMLNDAYGIGATPVDL
jgi:L-alanine-DL-glutamate epimerase-like enolase superfamily enzyme